MRREARQGSEWWGREGSIWGTAASEWNGMEWSGVQGGGGGGGAIGMRKERERLSKTVCMKKFKEEKE